ncbi:hypothetical protein [Luteococcus sp.]|uniref:hypothetical protein n=1 Tax=Luteococcus sp. TaxID=1969402 RepID=UPI003736A9FF
MSTRHLAALTSVALVAATTAVQPALALAEGACDQLTTPLYQQFSSAVGTSLVTPWKNEYDKAASYQFTQAGTLGTVSTRAADGLVAVHRLSKGADFVTAVANDVPSWTKRGYTDQGVRFHAAPPHATCGVVIHRVARDGVHREVAAGGVAQLVGQGWVDVGAKYVVGGAPTPAPQVTAASGADADGRFSLAVIPDTQNESLRAGAPRMVARNNWLVARKGADQLDLRAAIQVGDIANWDTPDHDQYANAVTGMKVLEQAQVGWIGAVGNHDSYATGEGGSARPGVNVHEALRDTATYNSYFDGSHFRFRAATQAGRQDTSTHMFQAGGLKWMVVALELWPRRAQLDWAKQQVAAHPDRNVILLTHDYLDRDGKVVTGNGGYGDLPISTVRSGLVAKYSNVRMVLSGHQGVRSVLVEDFGSHRVVAMQQNYDNNADAMVRLVEVDAKAGTLKHTFRSTTSDRVDVNGAVIDKMAWVR